MCAAVTGRRGVGRSTVARALARAGVTVTDSPTTADLTVRVLADAVKPEDHAAIESAQRPTLVVLNKADLIKTSAAGRHPNTPSTAARGRCAQLAARAGVAVEPLAALLAVAELDDSTWSALQGADGEVVPALDIVGTRQARAAIRRGASRADVDALLRALSGIDGVVDKLCALGAQPRYQRVLDAVAELETMAITDRRIGAFLSHDDTVIARMEDAIAAATAAGIDVDRGDTATHHLRRAVHWQRRPYGVDIARGSLRLWSRAGGSV
ncbi:hypothetical protein [Candidatus Mycobacterium wuenschmannii]|uniref:hypothetical protein n=1 Tax=Candidatus Mycobacterium wuenschmannii TaxID=3027808 RepID=UPI0036F3E5C5